MTISEQLNRFKEALLAVCPKTEIASDPGHLFGMFSDGSPEGRRAVVMFTGETKRGEYEELGQVDRTFLIVITAGRGMVDKGDATRAGSGYKPIYETLETAREALRALDWAPGAEDVASAGQALNRYADYKGAGIFTLPDGRPVDGYQLEFAVATQLPVPGSVEG